MNTCPKCKQTDHQHRAGKTGAGSQRYRCGYCRTKYTPDPKPWVYGEEVRQKALQLYVDGLNLRRIARHLGMHHSTISAWVQQKAATLPSAPVPEEVDTAELDGLFTYCFNQRQLLKLRFPHYPTHVFQALQTTF